MDLATLLTSGFIATGSGSAGSETLSRNSSKLYVRERVVPTDPASAFQMGRRNQLAFMWSRWITLSQARRDGWAVYGSVMRLRNALGSVYSLPPYQAFVYVNFPRFMGAIPILLDAPAVFRTDALSPVTVVPTTTAPRITVIFNEGDGWTDENGAGLLVFCARGQSGSVNWFKGPYRFCGVIRGNPAPPPSSPYALGSGFGFLQVGQNWFGRCYSVRADGRRSPVQFIGPIIIES